MSGRKSAETLEREAADRARIDALPMVARCGEPGCETWEHEGTTAECRSASEDHRARTHPGLAARRAAARRRAEKAEKDAKAAAVAEARRKPKAPPKPKPAPAPRVSRAKPPRAVPAARPPRRPRLSTDDCLRSLHAVTDEKGRTPTSNEWNIEKRKPSLPSLYRLFGNWRGFIEAGGYEYKNRYDRAREAA